MAHLYRLTVFFSFLLVPSVSFAIVFGNGVGEVSLTGFTKQPDGTYARAFPNFDLDLNNPPKGITGKSSLPVSTSKGVFPFEISKTATVDTTKLGSKVAAYAKRVGPLGMGLTAASLLCELTSICEQAGEWIFGETITEITALSCANVGSGTITYKSGGFYNKYKLIPKSQCGGTVPNGWGIVSSCSPSVHGCAFGDDMIKESAGSPSTQVSEPHTPTESEWLSKQPLLNDDRFTPHLISAGEPVPLSGLPTTPPGQTKIIDQKSVPVRDTAGNVTGRDDSETVIEAVDAATAESPGKVIIKETTITKRYDNNNTLISTSESTNYTAQTQETKPQSFEIKFDEVAPAELQTHTVPNTFSSTSWGGGSCPPNIDVALSNFSFTIPTQPVCDTAEMLNPFVLLLASMIGVYIISGVRGGNAT